jgi:hypothetical protein
LLAGRGDEMNGLDPGETRRTLERGQGVFGDVFGEPARTFLAPAWQLGHVCLAEGNTLGLEQVLGFFSLESRTGRKVPLATWTWDCGRWGWLGHLGHGIGRLSQSLDRGVPTLAIHPRDLERGFWPRIVRLTRELIDSGYEPNTPSALLQPVGAAGAPASAPQALRRGLAGASSEGGSEPRGRSEPAKRGARACAGESEGRSRSERNEC